MQPIRKRPEPVGLKKFKEANKGRTWPKKPNPGPYEEFTEWEFSGAKGDAFDELRTQLLTEQFHLCAYCGMRIASVFNGFGTPQMKAEHFNPKDNTIKNDLHYHNLLCVCLGNQDSKNDNHCDSSKGEKQLRYVKNPSALTNRDHQIIYNIRSNDRAVFVISRNSGIDEELEKVLNLNDQRIVSRRYEVWENLILKVLPEKEWTSAKLTQLRNEYGQPFNGQNIEFKDFILWWLDEQIKRRP
jgi:uncharacterized protein (TIGR02646 family)